eukprot:Rmarinus@m.15714
MKKKLRSITSFGKESRRSQRSLADILQLQHKESSKTDGSQSPRSGSASPSSFSARKLSECGVQSPKSSQRQRMGDSDQIAPISLYASSHRMRGSSQSSQISSPTSAASSVSSVSSVSIPQTVTSSVPPPTSSPKKETTFDSAFLHRLSSALVSAGLATQIDRNKLTIKPGHLSDPDGIILQSDVVEKQGPEVDVPSPTRTAPGFLSAQEARLLGSQVQQIVLKVCESRSSFSEDERCVVAVVTGLLLKDRERRSAHEKQVADLETRVEDLMHSFIGGEKKASAAAEECDRLRVQLSDSQALCESLRRQCDSLHGELTQTQERLETTAGRCDEERALWSRTRGDMEVNLENLKADLLSMSDEAARAELVRANLQSQVDDLSEQQRNSSKFVESEAALRKQLADVSAELTAMKASREGDATELARLAREVEGLQGELELSQARCRDFSRQRDMLTGRLQNAKKDAEDETMQLRYQLVQLSAKVEALTNQKGVLAGQLLHAKRQSVTNGPLPGFSLPPTDFPRPRAESGSSSSSSSDMGPDVDDTASTSSSSSSDGSTAGGPLTQALMRLAEECSDEDVGDPASTAWVDDLPSEAEWKKVAQRLRKQVDAMRQMLADFETSHEYELDFLAAECAGLRAIVADQEEAMTAAGNGTSEEAVCQRCDQLELYTMKLRIEAHTLKEELARLEGVAASAARDSAPNGTRTFEVEGDGTSAQWMERYYIARLEALSVQSELRKQRDRLEGRLRAYDIDPDGPPPTRVEGVAEFAIEENASNDAEGTNCATCVRNVLRLRAAERQMGVMKDDMGRIRDELTNAEVRFEQKLSTHESKMASLASENRLLTEQCTRFMADNVKLKLDATKRGKEKEPVMESDLRSTYNKLLAEHDRLQETYDSLSIQYRTLRETSEQATTSHAKEIEEWQRRGLLAEAEVHRLSLGGETGQPRIVQGLLAQKEREVERAKAEGRDAAEKLKRQRAVQDTMLKQMHELQLATVRMVTSSVGKKYYACALGLPDCDAGNRQAINKHFKRLAKTLHPDKLSHNPLLRGQADVSATFKMLREAKDALASKAA